MKDTSFVFSRLNDKRLKAVLWVKSANHAVLEGVPIIPVAFLVL